MNAKQITLGVVALSSLAFASAQTVAQWTFASNLNATTTATNVTASAVGFTFSQSAGGHSAGKGINFRLPDLGGDFGGISGK